MDSNTHITSTSPRPHRSRRARTDTRRAACDDNMSPFESWMLLCLAPVYLHYRANEDFTRDMPTCYASNLGLVTIFLCMAEAAAFGAAGLVLWGIGKCLAKLIRKTQRPKYYPQERMRRRRLAKERRSVRKRFTLNKIPTPEMLLEQWEHVRESSRDMIAFGSMLCDLEAYVDNSLIRDEYGEIIGRHPGIRGWLAENCPQLGLKYKTVMKYKTMAEKFRQTVGLSDPYPATMVLEHDENMVRNSQGGVDKTVDRSNENMVRNSQDGGESGAEGVVCDEVIRKAKEAAKMFFEEIECGLRNGDEGEADIIGKTVDGNENNAGKIAEKTEKKHIVTQKCLFAALDGRLSPESVPLEIEIQERRRQGLPDHDGILRKFTEMMA